MSVSRQVTVVRIRVLLMVACLCLVLGGACGSEVAAKVQGLKSPFAEKPILLTSVGQSADVFMLSVAASNVGLKCELNALVKAQELTDKKYKTVVFAVGGSAKGLGSAGIDQDQELARCMGIINAVKDYASIIVVHIGGKARRGSLSDRFIREITPHADYVLVLTGGNDDGLFTQIAESKNIPIDIIATINESGSKLAAAFK